MEGQLDKASLRLTFVFPIRRSRLSIPFSTLGPPQVFRCWLQTLLYYPCWTVRLCFALYPCFAFCVMPTVTIEDSDTSGALLYGPSDAWQTTTAVGHISGTVHLSKEAYANVTLSFVGASFHPSIYFLHITNLNS